MEFTINRETFLEGIQKTLGIVEGKTSIPIMQNLLIRTVEENDGIEILATNREIGIRTNYDASVIKSGELTIPAKKLNEIVRELQGETVHLVTKGKGAAVITSNKTVCKINGMTAADYPDMTNPDDVESFAIAPSLLCDMLKKVSYATLKDETSKNISGVFLQKIVNSDSASIRMAATDFHRLAVVATVITGMTNLPIPENGVILPRKGFSEIRKIAESAEEDVTIGFAKGSCIVEADKTTLRVSLIDSNYPDIERVIPDESVKGIITISAVRDTFLHALRRMAIYGI
jgi:DNA polymerase-3 subunit beta